MANDYKDRLLISMHHLYRDIDKCINNLIAARKYRDGRDQEYLVQMERLMVASLQQFGCIIDFFDKQIKEEESDWNMIGDFILAILKWWKQNITCIHDYKYFGTIDYRYEKCTKCDKLKHNYNPNVEAFFVLVAICVFIAIAFIAANILYEYYSVK